MVTSYRFDSGLRHFYLENYHVCGSSLFCSEKNIKVQRFPKSESVADFFGKNLTLYKRFVKLIRETLGSMIKKEGI